MVNYCFAGTKYHIHGCEPYRLPEFEIFKDQSKNTDGLFNIDIYVKYYDEEPRKIGKEVFRDISGVFVHMDDSVEVRYFDDIFRGVTYAMLIETPEMNLKHQKELWIDKQYADSLFVDDRKILNLIAFEKDLARQNKIILHSSFIETDGGAILFTAPCQTGKSTQAELWRKYKHAEVHNGDRTCIYKEDGIWYAVGIPWCGTSGIMHNVKVPLKAIVVLAQGPENVLHRQKVREFLPAVMKQTTINSWDHDMFISARNLWLDLAVDVPVYHLSCLPDQGAVDILAEELGV